MFENIKTRVPKVLGNRWLLFSLLMAVCGLAYHFGSILSAGKVSNGGLFVENRHLNFGKVWVDKSFSWKVPILNRTQNRVEILGFATSCSCVVSIKPRSFDLEPGDFRETVLTLDLGPKPFDKKDSWERELETTIVAQVKGTSVFQVGWQFKGIVRDPFRGLPPEIDLGDHHPEDSPKVRSFVIQCHPEVQRVKVKYDPGFFTVNLGKFQETTNSFKVSISFVGKMKKGLFRVPVFLTPITVSGNVLPAISFYVFGNIPHDVTISRTDFTYGGLRLGTKCKEVLTLRSRNGKPYDVEIKVSNPESLTLQETNSQLLGVRKFNLFIRVNKTGPQKENIHLNVKNRGLPSVAVDYKIGINYHGIP